MKCCRRCRLGEDLLKTRAFGLEHGHADDPALGLRAVVGFEWGPRGMAECEYGWTDDRHQGRNGFFPSI